MKDVLIKAHVTSMELISTGIKINVFVKII